MRYAIRLAETLSPSPTVHLGEGMRDLCTVPGEAAFALTLPEVPVQRPYARFTTDAQPPAASTSSSSGPTPVVASSAAAAAAGADKSAATASSSAAISALDQLAAAAADLSSVPIKMASSDRGLHSWAVPVRVDGELEQLSTVPPVAMVELAGDKMTVYPQATSKFVLQQATALAETAKNGEVITIVPIVESTPTAAAPKGAQPAAVPPAAPKGAQPAAAPPAAASKGVQPITVPPAVSKGAQPAAAPPANASAPSS